MAELTLADLSKEMRKIDFAMLSTHTEGEQIAARPMSNNGDVEYKGDSYYFAREQSRTVRDIEKNPKVSLSFQGGNALMIAVEGQAELIREKAAFREHWTKDLDRYFEQGVESDDLVMIKVQATRIHYWKGEQEGELSVS